MAHKVKVGGEVFLIESSYPIPGPSSSLGRYSPLRQAIMLLEVGESIAVPATKVFSVKSMMQKEKHVEGSNKLFTLRKETAKKSRIWRIK